MYILFILMEPSLVRLSPKKLKNYMLIKYLKNLNCFVSLLCSSLVI